jgi:PilZ domain-containing protein
MQKLARLERVESRNRRLAPRRELSLGMILPETGDEVVIHDLSATGMLIETDADLATFEQLQLDLPEVGKTVATVMWSSSRYFGCEFHRPIPKAAISAALLQSPFEQPAAVAPAAIKQHDGDDDESEVEDDRFPFGARLRVIIGSSLVLWAIILWAVGVL